MSSVAADVLRTESRATPVQSRDRDEAFSVQTGLKEVSQ